jgi:hypothetical protein
MLCALCCLPALDPIFVVYHVVLYLCDTPDRGSQHFTVAVNSQLSFSTSCHLLGLNKYPEILIQPAEEVSNCATTL